MGSRRRTKEPEDIRVGVYVIWIARSQDINAVAERAELIDQYFCGIGDPGEIGFIRIGKKSDSHFSDFSFLMISGSFLRAACCSKSFL